ncbi:hypothetical protein NP603_02220 [Methylomonas sp. SURF-1]|uniref:PEP-CTERM sorting domain-containing protein n=1 Tax=Methylomonas aurea TaxID=2952224 RepID=A0ABT1UDJ4_9GAMM|nr:hypothetical protein [Methylomonas sp. SURF-1]MCQ8179913.1 hypothetical protein [Methylomonas sp. SURF-1]
MNKFSKTLVAAALLAGAGAANASISVLGSTDATRELYFQAYDSVSKLTYSLDLGITLAQLIPEVSNESYTVFRDLSSDANWTAMTSVATYNPTNVQYVLAVGRSSKLFITQKEGNALPAYDAPLTTSGVATVITNHAKEINVGLANDASLNVSKLVSDTDAPGSGQWATGLGNLPDDIWGTTGGSAAAVAFGQKADFWYAQGTNVTKAAGQWLLSGNTLEYKVFPVSQVPLPGAVWMFGAGLMGLLRATRRKWAVAA